MVGPTEQVFAPPIIQAAGRILPSPAQFYLTGEDRLRVVSANSLTGVRLKIQIRLANQRGEAFPESLDHTPNTDRSVKSQDYEIGIGSLLNITVFAGVGAPLIGQTFVIVQLVRGVGAAAIVLGTLLSGYVTSTQALGFPGSPIQSSIEGGGYVRSILGTHQAVGNDFTETVPTGARWELLAIGTTFRASGAGNRYPSLRTMSTIAGYDGLFFQKNAINAGGNWTVTWGPTLSSDIDTTNLRVQDAIAPGLVLVAGDVFQSGTAGMGAGDQWDAPVCRVREWLEVN